MVIVVVVLVMMVVVVLVVIAVVVLVGSGVGIGDAGSVVGGEGGSSVFGLRTHLQALSP